MGFWCIKEQSLGIDAQIDNKMETSGTVKKSSVMIKESLSAYRDGLLGNIELIHCHIWFNKET